MEIKRYSTKASLVKKLKKRLKTESNSYDCHKVIGVKTVVVHDSNGRVLKEVQSRGTRKGAAILNAVAKVKY